MLVCISKITVVVYDSHDTAFKNNLTKQKDNSALSRNHLSIVILYSPRPLMGPWFL